jgi:hypothetical protein
MRVSGYVNLIAASVATVTLMLIAPQPRAALTIAGSS